MKTSSAATLWRRRHATSRAERDGTIRLNRPSFHIWARVLLLATSLLLIAIGLAAPLLAQSRVANIVEMDAIIGPITERYIELAIQDAERTGAEVVVITLDTPGGLLSSTRGMVEAILNSPVPIVVYVSPSGGRAASAGTFITAAAHIAVMAPATNIGAASPVGGQGEDLPETLKSKAFQDAAAEIRAIAQTRGRPVDPLEATVLEAKSYTANEALELGIIDHIASSVNDLLTMIDGTEVVVMDGQNERTVILATGNLAQKQVRMGLFDRILYYLADPNITFLLISLGGLGLVVEIWNPGLIFPGVMGLIALILGLLALGSLPGNWAGAALILLAFILFSVEFYVDGFGGIRRARHRQPRPGGHPALLALRHAVSRVARHLRQSVGHRARGGNSRTDCHHFCPRIEARAPDAARPASAGACRCGHDRRGSGRPRPGGQGPRAWRNMERAGRQTEHA